MQIEILNDNPLNFCAYINGGLDLHIHHTDGVVASYSIPNIEALRRYVEYGVHEDVQRDAEEVERILRGVQDVVEELSEDEKLQKSIKKYTDLITKAAKTKKSRKPKP
ncbi:hypothetical protein ACNCWV_002092 [Escherichia coli]